MSSGLQEPSPETSSQAVARPLAELVPLIQNDIQQGREAAERAALPFYRAAGAKLLEAKSQIKHGHFQQWAQRHFKISTRTARYYMGLAEATAKQSGNALPFSSLKDFIRQSTRPRIDPAFWRAAIRDIENDQQSGTRAIQRDLALQLIDRGYKALARELHPDRTGGSDEMMKHLHAVRDRLKRIRL